MRAVGNVFHRRKSDGTSRRVRTFYAWAGGFHCILARQFSWGSHTMQEVKFRLVNPELKPRRTKLEMPGWAGQPAPRTDGSQDMLGIARRLPKARNTASRSSIPIAMSFASAKRRHARFRWRFRAAARDGDLMWPPFRSFGRDYYSCQFLLDLKVGKDWAVRTEPHPRFYTDPDRHVPIAVPALLRTEWWPMISFMIFKAPAEGPPIFFGPASRCCRSSFCP